MTAPQSPANRRQMLIVWAAMLSSHFMYLVVLLVLPQRLPAEPALVLPLSAAAIVAGLAALGLHFQVPEDRPRMFQMNLLSWALAESVTLIGLVLVLVGQLPLQRFYVFLGGGIALMLVCRPRLPATSR